MAIYDSGTSSYGLNKEEYFINVEDIYMLPDEIKAYIPKLMPNITLGDGATIGREALQRNIFANAGECGVTNLNALATTQNFLTVKHYANEIPSFMSIANEFGIVAKHQKFILEINQNDLLSMHFVSKM